MLYFTLNTIISNILFLDKDYLDSIGDFSSQNGKAIPSLGYQFIQIFTLVCLGEIGDRSQVSIIYISNQASFNIVFGSIVISNILLSVVSVLCGKILATKLSVRSLTLISGWLFVFLGLIALGYSVLTDFMDVTWA